MNPTDIERHPSSAVLAAYSQSTLDPRLELVVAVHLEMCEVCCEAVMEPAIDPSIEPNSIDNALSRAWSAVEDRVGLDSLIASSPRTDRSRSPISLLDRYLPGSLDGIPWRPLTSGMSNFLLSDFPHGDGWIRMFRFMPGTVVPSHRHQGEEYSLVLQGSYHDLSGHFGVGDFSGADTDYRHEPVVDSDTACIALIASTGRLRFDNHRYKFGARLLGL